VESDINLPILHAVTNDEIVRRPDFLDQARAFMAASGSRGALQLRAPRTDGAPLFELALRLAETQRETGAWLVVNDRVDVALCASAKGVQLTARSLELEDAQRVAPTLAIGVSVHDLHEGIAARLSGAWWGVVSRASEHADRPSGRDVHAARPTPSSDNALALISQLARGDMPVIVIGGVVPQHVAPLRRIGVYGVAAIRGIWDTENAARAASDYLTHYDRDGGG
jgi:thiamine-phosphate pyrophosphorylase